MNRASGFVFLLAIFMAPVRCLSQDALSDHLNPLRPFLGTWKGKVSENKSGEPVFDISRWERILNGNGIRILHSVNDGAYGGETIIVWDKNKASLVFYYFTTAGFHTEGTIKIENGKMKSHEYVEGNENGITEVEATSEIISEMKMKTTSRFFQNNQWGEESTATYIFDPEAEIIFK